MQTSAIRSGFLLGLLCTAVHAESYLFDAVYTGELLGNVSGGLNSGSLYLDNLDLTLEVDVAKAWGLGDGTVFVYGLYNNGSTFADELVGDLQVTSNIDAPEGLRIFEAWYEYREGPWSTRMGLYDLNSEFDVNGAGALFLGSSHGIGSAFSQTGENGPSIFPISSLGIRGDWQAQWLTARLAILDGVPGDPRDPESNEVRLGGDDGALLVAEVDVPMAASGRFWAGYWRYTADFERPFAAGCSDGNDGWYLGAECALKFGDRAASVFLRYGRANENLNPLEDYLGAGIVIDGPLLRRPDDQLGLAVASAGAGDPYRRFLDQSGAGSNARETIWELTWRARLNGHVAIQPNVQWVSNPSAMAEIDDAWIIGIRFEIAT